MRPSLDTALAGKGRDNMPVVYISGPMTGYENFNFAVFNEMARKLRLLGFHVLNPADFGADPGKTWEYCIKRDLDLIPHADLILLLEGWGESKGAGLEFDRAIALGKPAVTEEDFPEKVLSRFFSIDEYNDLMTLDDWRRSYVIARFGDGAVKILPREEARGLKAISDSVLLLLGVDKGGAFLDELCDTIEEEEDDDAEG